MPIAYFETGIVAVTRAKLGEFTRWRIQGVANAAGEAVSSPIKLAAELWLASFAVGNGYTTATTQTAYLYDDLEIDQLAGLCASKSISAVSRTVLHDAVITGVQSRPLVVAGPLVLRFVANAAEAVRFQLDLLGFDMMQPD